MGFLILLLFSGTWVDTQRVNYRKQKLAIVAIGKQSERRLSTDRIARLEALGFVWNLRRSHAKEDRILERNRLFDEKWDDFYLRLVKFAEKNNGVSLLRCFGLYFIMRAFNKVSSHYQLISSKILGYDCTKKV